VRDLVAVLIRHDDVVDADPPLLPASGAGGGEHIARVGRLQPVDGRGGGERRVVGAIGGEGHGGVGE